jgi:SAM-dependent methyltransferase
MSHIDRINRRTMSDATVVRGYTAQDELSPPERVLLDRVRDVARGQAILDLGVGGGRTVAPLRAISEDYVGIDYSPDMVASCRRRFPGVRIDHGDARDLSSHRDGRYRLVVFSCNGLGMVGHDDRLRVLSEVRRVLAPGGAFVFSTHNRACPDHDAAFRLPELELSRHPVRLGVRALRFARRVAVRARNRSRHRPLEWRTRDYSIVNDVCHDYGTMLYYIDLAAQRRQLERAGFAPGAEAYDLSGKQVEHTTDSSVSFLAWKHR